MFSPKKLLFFGIVIMYILHVYGIMTINMNIVLLLMMLITGVIAYCSDIEGFGVLNEEAVSSLASMYEDGNLKVSNVEVTGSLKVNNADITGNINAASADIVSLKTTNTETTGHIKAHSTTTTNLNVNGDIVGERYIYLRDHKNGDRQYIIGSGIGTNDEQALGIHDSANYGTTFKVSGGRPVRFGDRFYFTANYLNNNKCGGENVSCTDSNAWGQNTFTIHSG